jgi:DNA-binding GntR family transcriptional regulator
MRTAAATTDVREEPVRRSLSATIRCELERDILSGRLAAGAQIDEQLLAGRFSVSRTPAREALVQLAAIGLLTMRPRQGATVTAISPKDYVNLSEILVPLESLAAQLATRRMNRDERQRMREVFDECREAADRGDTDAYRAANDRFHELLYVGSRNDILAAQIRTARARMRGLRDLRFENPARVRASVQEHAAILEAVLAGDEQAAVAAMALHIGTGGQSCADMIAQLP